MKKVFLLFLAIALVFTSSLAISFATVEDKAELRYVTATTVTSKVVISGSKATYFAEVMPQTLNSIDSINATIKLVNGSGSVIDSKTATVSRTGAYFSISDTATLTKSGTYHVEYTLKVYKSGVLKETITGKSAGVKY